ncbi:MAG TPA: ABC transporter permease [Terriglobales bacterium]|nr:ABC transporter permease [Terriglobales bacterium]
MSSVARSEATGAVRYRSAPGMKREEGESSAPSRHKSQKGLLRKIANQVIFYSVLLGAWALLAKLKVWPPYLFPAPWQVAEALWSGMKDHSFLIGIAVTMKRMLIGYSLSVVLGMILGIGVASNRFLEETVGPLLVSLQSLPSICWVPLAILWFGLTEKAILFVVLMGCILSVTIAMEDGRKQMPKIYTMAGRNLGASGFRLFWYVMLPASLPYIVSGLKQGWAFGWRSLIQAEMIFLTVGLGQQLMMGRDLNDMSQVIAVMILIVALGSLVNRLVFRTMERTLQSRWGLNPTA